MKAPLILLAVSAIALQLSAASSVYKIELLRDSLVHGQQLKAGTYRVEIKGNSEITMRHGKQVIDVPAREETSDSNYSETELIYEGGNTLQTIRLAGTNLELDFDTPSGTTSTQSR